MKVSAPPSATTAAPPAVRARAELGLTPKEARAKAAEIVSAKATAGASASVQSQDFARSTAKAREEVRNARKDRAHQDVIRLREEFKLIRKLYAANPQEMARQLARIFKDLKQALKVYADAIKDDPGAKSVVGVDAPAPSGPEANVVAEKAVARSDADTPARKEGERAPETETRAAREDARAAAREAAQAYLKQAPSEDRAARVRLDEQAKQTLAFLDEVKGLVADLRKSFVEARIKAAFLGEGRNEKSEPFKDADKALKDLEEDMNDMQADAKADLLPPTRSAAVSA